MHPDLVPSVPVAQAATAEALLDVREHDEWAGGHAPHAVHVPLHELPGRLGEVPRGGVVHVVCRVGSRSAHATAFLRAQGIEAVNVDGGMLAWQARGLPLVGDVEPPRVL